MKGVDLHHLHAIGERLAVAENAGLIGLDHPRNSENASPFGPLTVYLAILSLFIATFLVVHGLPDRGHQKRPIAGLSAGWVMLSPLERSRE